MTTQPTPWGLAGMAVAGSRADDTELNDDTANRSGETVGASAAAR